MVTSVNGVGTNGSPEALTSPKSVRSVRVHIGILRKKRREQTKIKPLDLF